MDFLGLILFLCKFTTILGFKQGTTCKKVDKKNRPFYLIGGPYFGLYLPYFLIGGNNSTKTLKTFAVFRVLL